RSITILSGAPLSVIAIPIPVTIAITITNTATARAMPPAVITVETRLTSKLRTLYFKGIAISQRTLGHRQCCDAPLSRLGSTHSQFRAGLLLTTSERLPRAIRECLTTDPSFDCRY